MKSLVEYDEFDWDDANYVKVQKHGLLIEEIELFFNQPLLVTEDANHSHEEKRFIALGKSSDDKLMFVAFTFRILDDQTCLRVISARYAHQKEYFHYEKIKKKL